MTRLAGLSSHLQLLILPLQVLQDDLQLLLVLALALAVRGVLLRLAAGLLPATARRARRSEARGCGRRGLRIHLQLQSTFESGGRQE